MSKVSPRPATVVASKLLAPPTTLGPRISTSLPAWATAVVRSAPPNRARVNGSADRSNCHPRMANHNKVLLALMALSFRAQHARSMAAIGFTPGTLLGAWWWDTGGELRRPRYHARVVRHEQQGSSGAARPVALILCHLHSVRSAPPSAERVVRLDCSNVDSHNANRHMYKCGADKVRKPATIQQAGMEYSSHSRGRESRWRR